MTTLLVGPIQLLAETFKDVHFVILLDALDEADPPAAETASQAANSGSVSHYDNPNCEGVAPVVPFGNKMFQLLMKHFLPQLPSFVRFIVTTRRQAVNGDIEATLRRSTSNVRCLTVKELVGLSQMPAGPVAAPAPLLPLPVVRFMRSFGCLHGDGSMERSHTGNGDDKNGGVLVYHAVVALCNLAPEPQGARRLRTAHTSPTMSDLQWAYS